MRPTVLIVDDHADFRVFARVLLEAEGFAVVGEAHDGASALLAAQELTPSVVLLDVTDRLMARLARATPRRPDRGATPSGWCTDPELAPEAA